MRVQTTTRASDLRLGQRITLVLSDENRVYHRIPCLVLDIFNNAICVLKLPTLSWSGKLIPGTYNVTWYELMQRRISAEYVIEENAATKA